MSKELFEKRNKLTYDLRLALDKWEADNNKPTSEFDNKANGLLREQVERLEKDLDQVESQLARNLSNEKQAKREAELAKPEFDTRSKNFIQPQDDYTNRFAKELFSGNRIGLDRLMAERTSLTTGATNVSAAIPTEWQNRIVEKINQLNIMRSLCPVRNVTADQKIVIGGALPTAVLMTEGTAITEDSTHAVANVTVGDFTYGCFVPVSKQFASDAIGGLEYVARKAGEALANKLESAYLLGESSGPTGLIPLLEASTASAAVDSGGSTLTITGDQIIDMAYAVAPQYRMNGSYLFSDDLIKVIRKIKTASGSNEYVWKMPERYSDIRDGAPATLFGRPAYMSPAMNTGTTADTCVGLFGDFNYAEIYDRDGGVNVFIDPYGLSTALVTRVVVSHRTDLVLTNKAAFCRYKI
jgi:HK97 family phage major capsid protein